MTVLASSMLPDRERIFTITKEAKDLDLQAFKLEDQSRFMREPTHGDSSAASDQSTVDLQTQSIVSEVEQGIFLGGYDALLTDSTLESIGITHILSICQYYLPVSALLETHHHASTILRSG